MAENYSFFNSKDHDRIYNARHWADYFFPLFKSGVFNGDLQVVANGGMAVKIKEGYAWIDGYGYHLTDGLPLDLETASGNMNRMDSIVIRLDLTNRWIKAFCKTGSYYAGEPTPPAPEITATIHEIVIAHISVAAGVTEITQDMITDTRMDGDICGWVCGTVEEIDFEQITAQFNAYFAQYQEKITAEFKTYVAYMTNLEAQFNTFQAELSEKETELHEQHEKDIKDYLLQFQKKGDSNLTELTQQLIDFRNTNEAEFIEWFETIKDVFSTDAAGRLLLEIDKLKEQVEFNRMMITTGKVLTQIETSQGDYLTDSMGNPILAGWSICQCNR